MGQSSRVRYLIRKVKHPSQKGMATLMTVVLWTMVITLWNTTNNQKALVEKLVSQQPEPEDTLAHKIVRKWHQTDSIVPRLFPTTSSRWNEYPKDRLFAWQEVDLNAVRCPAEEPRSSANYGDMGVPVIVPARLRDKEERMMEKHSMNVAASDLVSLNRRLPDVRHPKCQIKVYPRALPQASVIVIFNNEALSTLLRTVHSVINRSPEALLKEVILVDDASENDDLKDPLSAHVATLPVPVTLSRLSRREGLIRARLAGAKVAMGDVLVFLDAHTEASHGWLEPILSEIANDRTRVIIPVIDDISQKDFSYDPAENDLARGGLDWKLMHSWIDSSPDFVAPDEAFPSPIMIGCAFAMDREFFYAVGSYDEQMKIWGGENVEISVRVWRCGGSLLVAPCSHVGHVYRDSTPHSIPGGFRAKMDTLTINTARFAEVWLDEYADFYKYMNPASKQVDVGDLSQRRQLLSDLKCHSFKWFIDNVYKDAPFPNGDLYLGQVQHYPEGLCLNAQSPSKEAPALSSQCLGLGGLQTILATKSKELRSATRCLQPQTRKNQDNQTVAFVGCDFSTFQKWEFRRVSNSNGFPSSRETPGQLVHLSTGLCLALTRTPRRKTPESEKSMLTFLASVAFDAGFKAESPRLEKCQTVHLPSDKNAENQLWLLNGPADWGQPPLDLP